MVFLFQACLIVMYNGHFKCFFQTQTQYECFTMQQSLHCIGKMTLRRLYHNDWQPLFRKVLLGHAKAFQLWRWVSVGHLNSIIKAIRLEGYCGVEANKLYLCTLMLITQFVYIFCEGKRPTLSQSVLSVAVGKRFWSWKKNVVSYLLFFGSDRWKTIYK